MGIVSRVPAADSGAALNYFQSHLANEADCWDVPSDLSRDADFVLLDVRSPDTFSRCHVPGSVNLPYSAIDRQALERFAQRTLFVVYCNGPHCNAGHRAAARLASLGRPVKEMIGGMMGWRYSGFAVEGSDVSADRKRALVEDKPNVCS